MTEPLKLRAEDADDLAVISACLQDAIVPLRDVCFLPDEGLFAMVVNRFKRETGPDRPVPRHRRAGTFERTNCGVRFDGVRRVRTRNIDTRRRGQMLNLPAIEQAADGSALHLHFSGDMSIRLEVDRWSCRVADLGEPWPTGRCPSHAEVLSA